MSSDQNNLYSQGFNFGSFVQDGVDPRTGQFTSSITLYESPAKARNCVPLKLILKFNSLSQEDVGFGKGWSLNLSQYRHLEPRSLTLSTGEHYQIVETGGVLRAVDQKLKSFQFKKKDSNFQIIHKDGTIEVLSNAHNVYNYSVPVTLYAVNGRALTLTWVVVQGQPRLSKIQEGSETLLQVNYRDPRVEVTRAPGTPDATTFTILQQNNQLREFWLPLAGSPKWKFTYEDFGTISCLSNVSNPVRRTERVTYDTKSFKLPPGAPYQSIPVVIQHTMEPGNQQPAIRTLYTYSTNNFLGYGAVDKWKVGEDNLYRVRDDYQYWATVSVDGGQKTTYTYNKFHLLVTTLQEKNGKQVSQTVTYYAKKDVALEHQPSQFQLPKSVQTTYRDTSKAGAYRTEVTQHEFDEWGNPTVDIQTDGVRTDRSYYPPAGEIGKCPADPHGFQRHVKEKTITPAKKPDAAPVRTTVSTYSAMETATGAPTTSFALARESQAFQDDQCVSSIAWTHVRKPDNRDHGRLQNQTTKVFEKYPAVQSWTYEYPSARELTETLDLQTFDEVKVRERTTYSMNQELIMSHVDHAGVRSNFQYDQIGRQVSTTASPGTSYEATQKVEYVLMDAGAGLIATVTDVKGVKTKYTTDGLERVCQVEKQDDDGSWDANGMYTGTFRVVEQNSYNSIGQCSQEIEVDWLRSPAGPTKQSSRHDYDYDDWGHVSKVTDSNGVVTLTKTDPITQTRTEGIQKKGKKKATFETDGILTQMALLKSNDSIYSRTNYVNDGLGRAVKLTDNLNNTTQHVYDSFDRVSKTTWPDKSLTTTEYAGQSAKPLPTSMQIQSLRLGTQAFDGLNRLVNKSIGGRTTLLSYENSSPKPSVVTSPRKDKADLAHEAALDYALTSLSAPDNSDNYHYDHRSAELLQGKNSYYKEDLTYLPSGLLKSESIVMDKDKTFSTKYTYSMDGRLQSYVDVHGQTQSLQYDDYGRLRQLSQGHLTVKLSYDDANHVSDTTVYDSEEGSFLTTHLSYDEFDREIERTVTNGSTNLYKLTLSYDTLSRITARVLKDSNDNVLREEGFEYDGMGRLFDYKCTGSSAPVDETGRKLQRQQYTFKTVGSLEKVSTTYEGGSENVASHTYSSSDPCQLIRITNTHPDEPKEISLQYDANGNLTIDEQGRHLEYDTLGNLTAVRNAKGAMLSQYHYDSRGRLVCQEIPNQSGFYLHYRHDKLVSATSGNSQISYVSDEHRYWGQIRKDSGKSTTQLWASDGHESVLAWLDTNKPDQINSQSYTPYGFCTTSSAIGFNGQWRDPVTGWYHLGDGNRVYNPVLKRFHSPDTISPFASGEVNSYAYCLGDPINRIDPSGHFSIFGWHIGSRNLAQMLVGLAVSIIAAIFTEGASLAIEVGVGAATGIVSDVTTRAIYDAASGKGPTWESVGKDFAFSAVSHVVTAGIAQGAKAGFKSFRETLDQLLEGAEKIRHAGGTARPRAAVSSLGKLRRSAAILENAQQRRKLMGSEVRTLKDLHARINNIERSQPWTWDAEHAAVALPKGRMSGTHQVEWEKYYKMRDLVTKQRFHPRQAAAEIGDAHFESVGALGFSVRLSQAHRVVFTMNQAQRLVRVSHIGGHPY